VPFLFSIITSTSYYYYYDFRRGEIDTLIKRVKREKQTEQDICV